jgi:outer membrane lipoprotein-sorting protein
MRRNRWRGIFAIGLVGLFLSVPTQLVAHAGIQGTGSAPAAGQAKVVPISADEQITRTDLTKAGTQRTIQSASHFYRDSQGRTRVETGSSVTITDPASGTVLLLSPKTQTYQRQATPAKPASGVPGIQSGQVTTQSRDLGKAVVAGVPVEGRGYTVSIPANKIQGARTKDVTIWLSRDLQLPVQTRIVDPAGQDYTTTYSNIRSGVDLAADLFTVPAGYREGSPAPRAGTNAVCPLDIYLDPEVMVSVRPYGGFGAVLAHTDAGNNCLIVDFAGYLEYPIWPFGISNLFLPDHLIVLGDGDPWGFLPFSPYVAFGDIAWAAASNTDVTVKDALLAMVVFG